MKCFVQVRISKMKILQRFVYSCIFFYTNPLLNEVANLVIESINQLHISYPFCFKSISVKVNHLTGSQDSRKRLFSDKK